MLIPINLKTKSLEHTLRCALTGPRLFKRLTKTIEELCEFIAKIPNPNKEVIICPLTAI